MAIKGITKVQVLNAFEEHKAFWKIKMKAKWSFKVFTGKMYSLSNLYSDLLRFECAKNNSKVSYSIKLVHSL